MEGLIVLSLIVLSLIVLSLLALIAKHLSKEIKRLEMFRDGSYNGIHECWGFSYNAKNKEVKAQSKPIVFSTVR